MRKLLALPLGLIFAALLAVAGVTLALRSFAFEPAYYTAALAARGALADFERDPLKYVDLSSALSQLSALPAETQRTIVAAALPPGWLERSAADALRDFFAWLASGDAPPPEIPIDLRPIKDRLQGPPGQDMARTIVAAIPDCAPGQSVSLSLDRLPECLPAGLDREIVIEQVVSALDGVGRALPNTADAGRFLIRGDAAALITAQRMLQPAVSLPSFALLIGLALAAGALGALIGGRTGKARLTWLGGWLLLAAIVMAMLAVAALVGGSRSILLGEAVSLPSPLTPAASDAVRSVAAQVVQQWSIRLMLLAAGAILTGAVLVIAGITGRVERNYRRA